MYICIYIGINIYIYIYTYILIHIYQWGKQTYAGLALAQDYELIDSLIHERMD